jgi:hypothetical protein
VVTLGFGFKSYVGYRLRMRKQNDVRKENDYYYEFLRQALPPGQLREEAFNAKPSPKPGSEERISDSGMLSIATNSTLAVAAGLGSTSSAATPNSQSASSALAFVSAGAGASSSSSSLSVSHSHFNGEATSSGKSWLKAANGSPPMGASNATGSANGDCLEDKHTDDDPNVGNSGGGGGGKGKSKQAGLNAGGGGGGGLSKDSNKRAAKDVKLTKEEYLVKLESEIKKFKGDLQISRNKENDLRDQIISYMSSK